MTPTLQNSNTLIWDDNLQHNQHYKFTNDAMDNLFITENSFLEQLNEELQVVVTSQLRLPEQLLNKTQ